jgi:hypothetical protein
MENYKVIDGEMTGQGWSALLLRFDFERVD